MVNHELPSLTDAGGQGTEETLDPDHLYAAYVFDRPEARKRDIATLVEQAGKLGYPLRYWWLSEAMDIRGYPDRLIVCVHHPSALEDVGMDLYEALREAVVEHQMTWDDLEAAAVEEYQRLGKPIEGFEGICWPDGTRLFPVASAEGRDVETPP